MLMRRTPALSTSCERSRDSATTRSMPCSGRTRWHSSTTASDLPSSAAGVRGSEDALRPPGGAGVVVEADGDPLQTGQGGDHFVAVGVPDSAVLVATEWEGGIVEAHGVAPDRPGLETVGDTEHGADVPRPDGCAQSVF